MLKNVEFCTRSMLNRPVLMLNIAYLYKLWVMLNRRIVYNNVYYPTVSFIDRNDYCWRFRSCWASSAFRIRNSSCLFSSSCCSTWLFKSLVFWEVGDRITNACWAWVCLERSALMYNVVWGFTLLNTYLSVVRALLDLTRLRAVVFWLGERDRDRPRDRDRDCDISTTSSSASCSAFWAALDFLFFWLSVSIAH